MTKAIFVTLPVTDLPASIRFYEAIGFTRNEQFSDDGASVMNWSDAISINLMTHAPFGGYTPKPIADAGQVTEMMLALSRDSREDVDAMIDAAAGAGGRIDIRDKQDLGFMYVRTFEDLDGHIFEPAWVDVSAMAEAS